MKKVFTMNEFDTPNYAEYIYDKKSEGKLLLARSLMIFLYIAFFGVFFLLCYLTRIIPLFAICPLITFILYLCTWRFVSYDCYFEFKAGTLELGHVRQKKSERRKSPRLKIEIKKAVYAALFSEAEERLSNVKKTYDFSESRKSPHRIAVIFLEKGEEAAAVFEGTAKVANLIASFCENGKSLKGKKFHS